MMRFTVLASGSSGNASLIEHDGFGLLIDAGLGPRMLGSRLAAIGTSWRQIHAVVLTHTHGDHWKDRTIASLVQHRIPLYCHTEHFPILESYSPSFALLNRADLVQRYERGEDQWLTPNLRFRPIELSHDSNPTFGFRLDGSGRPSGPGWSLGYLSDLGCWSRELVEATKLVDVLALEFNHDLVMERRSRRPAALVQRVLSDLGHLSNDQAADCFQAITDAGSPPRHLVQLHLSRECNRENLAQEAARRVVSKLKLPTEIHTSSQHQVGPILTLEDASKSSTRTKYSQPSLPGLE